MHDDDLKSQGITFKVHILPTTGAQSWCATIEESGRESRQEFSSLQELLQHIEWLASGRPRLR